MTERNESINEAAAREMEEKSPMEAVKDDVSKLVHGEDITSSEPSKAREEKEAGER